MSCQNLDDVLLLKVENKIDPLIQSFQTKTGARRIRSRVDAFLTENLVVWISSQFSGGMRHLPLFGVDDGGADKMLL